MKNEKISYGEAIARKLIKGKTEEMSWEENTKILEDIEQMIKEGKVTGDNWVVLYSKVSHIEGICSLGRTDRYIKRILYCRELEKKICEARND